MQDLTPVERFASSLAGRLIGSDSLVPAEWTGADPPLYIAPLHVHREDDEAWYVLEGRLCVRLGDEDVEVPAGDVRGVPERVPGLALGHGMWQRKT